MIFASLGLQGEKANRGSSWQKDTNLGRTGGCTGPIRVQKMVRTDGKEVGRSRGKAPCARGLHSRVHPEERGRPGGLAGMNDLLGRARNGTPRGVDSGGSRGEDTSGGA
jgi:hypothetical protein